MPDRMVKHFQQLPNYCLPWIQKLDFLGKLSHNVDQVRKNLCVLDQRRNLDFSKIFPATADFIEYQK
jgi:hypothetical protein